MRGYARVLRTPVTLGYTLATVFLQGVFTAYLAASELVIGDIFDREAQFPFIFGATAMGFGVAALVNGRVVERLGIDRVVVLVFAVQLPLTTAMVLLSVATDGTPSFWIFMPMLGLTLSSFMFLMPNLNTAAMGPVGELAGTAAALTGGLRMAGGAVLGTIESARVSNSVTPFAVGVAALCWMCAATVWIVRLRTARREQAVLLPVPTA
jgi:DHA1 family bicyclomycin/chloramphenicol resistance-like MFS transporter